ASTATTTGSAGTAARPSAPAPKPPSSYPTRYARCPNTLSASSVVASSRSSCWRRSSPRARHRPRGRPHRALAPHSRSTRRLPLQPATPAVPPTPPPPPSIGPHETRVETAPRAETPPPHMPPQPPTAPPVPPGQRGRFVVLNFDNADIETVVHAASEIVGFNYVLAPDVRGKVTVQTSGRIPQEDVFGVLLAILEVHGFTAVKSGNLYKIVRIEGARERAVPTIVGLEPDPNRTPDEVITQIVPVRFSSVSDLASLLRPLVSQRGNLVAHRETNVLMI